MGLAARASVSLRRDPWVCALLGRRPRSRRAAASPAPDRVPPGGRRPREGPAGRGGRASGRSSRRGPRAWTAWPCARRARIRLGHAGRGMAARASGLIEAAGSTTGEPVTFLIYSPFPKYSGGRENWLHNLAPHLKESGRPVRVIAYATDRAPFHAVEQSGIRVAALPSVRYFYDAFRFVNRLTLGLLKYLDIFFFYPMVAAIYLAATRPRNLV